MSGIVESEVDPLASVEGVLVQHNRLATIHVSRGIRIEAGGSAGEIGISFLSRHHVE